MPKNDFSTGQELHTRVVADDTTITRVACPACTGRGWTDIVPHAYILEGTTPTRRAMGTKTPTLAETERVGTTGWHHVQCEQCGGKGYIEAVW